MEKMVVSDIFSFSNEVFKRQFPKGHLILELCGKALTEFKFRNKWNLGLYSPTVLQNILSLQDL